MDNKPIRVAQVIGEAHEGGVESVVMNYYKNIDRAKVQFDFFVESTSKIIDKDLIESLGGKVIIIPSLKHIFNYQKTLRKLFKDGKYDIVHAHKTTLNVFSLRAAKKAGIKVRISHAHSTTSPKEKVRNVIKNILKMFSKMYATNYFACSETAGRWLFGNKAFDCGKVKIINNGIDIENFKFDEKVRKKYRTKYLIDNAFVIGHVGRFVQQKNHLFLLDIFNEILSVKPESVLLLVGDGPLYKDVIRRARELKISEKVVFCGTHKNTSVFYNMMDCFVLPSLYEGLPVVGIEAQINGLPCFFSNAITSEVKKTSNSYFLSLKATDGLWAKEIINKSYDYHDLTNRINSYRNFLESNFNIKYNSIKLLNLYLSATKGRNYE